MNRRWLIVLALLSVPAVPLAQWIEDKVLYQTESAGTIEFSHFNHLEAVGKNCPSCHNKIFHIDRSKNKPHTMAEMEKGKSCGACHNGNKAFSVAEDCSACHPTRDITFKEEDAGNVLFSHDVHTSMFGCGECHPDLFIPGPGNRRATMEQMEAGESCGACHDGGTAFSVAEDCEACHEM